MQKYQNNVINSAGTPVVGGLVQVLNYPAGTPATIYSDNGVTQTSNPLTTDVNGAFAFYAANGHYSLSISGPNINPITVSDVLILDMLPADLPTSLPGTIHTPWNNGGVISTT